MKPKKVYTRITTTLILMAALLFGGSSYYYVDWVSNSLEQEAVRTISETTIQASYSIRNMITGQIRVLDGIADTLSKANYQDMGEIRQYLSHFDEKYNFNRISICTPEGIAYASDGQTLNVSKEPGFQKALQGISNISPPFLDQISHREIITFNSPLVIDGEVRATLSASRYSQDLYEALGTSFFNGYGYSLIIDRKGTVILASQHPDSNHSIHNWFEYLSRDERNKKTLKPFSEQLMRGSSGVGSFVLDGDKKFIGYSKMQGINDWYVVSVVSKNVVMNRADVIIGSTYLLCLIVFTALMAIFAVISRSKKRHQQEMESIAFLDGLTKLPSGYKFHLDACHLLKKHAGSDTQMAVVQFNIDRFKYINEIYGYQEGNQILQHIGKTLQDQVCAGDRIGRLHGDRFILLTSYKTKAELWSRMNELNQHLSEYTSQVTEDLHLVIHCGIYIVIDKKMDIYTMMDRAGMAAKSVKGSYGSTCAFFSDEMLEQVVEEQNIERRMHDALANGEFEVYLQPKYDLNDRSMQCAEALIRWNHPEKGLIPPNAFIPVFEKNGFIVQVDLMVFEFVCSLIKRWMDQGIKPIPISVNFSRVHLFRSDFLLNLSSIIKKYSIPPALIEIELTESIVYENIDYLRDVLLKLKCLGFTLSIDDFGTGYSSLSLLQSIPADVIKLDRGFFLNEANDERGRIVIANMIKLAHDLKMRVVAEGVETEAQVQFLQSMNCNLAQGYYFAKPMPVAQFESNLFGETRVVEQGGRLD